jgi:TRAP-type C4-dicarboxylate transport system substrate-binding protein
MSRIAVRAVALLLISCGVTQASPIELKASPFGPPDHLLNREILSGWIQDVERATAGRVKVMVLPKPASPPPAVLDAIAQGLADVSIVSNSASMRPLPLNNLVSFPACGVSRGASPDHH